MFMVEEKISVSEAVRRVINRHPSIIDSLIFNYGNLSGIARMIYEEVVEELKGLHPSHYAIKMALKRYSGKLRSMRKLSEPKILGVLRRSQIELINDVVLLTYDKKYLATVIDALTPAIGGGRFIHLTQGRDTFTIVMDKMTFNRFKENIDLDNAIGVYKNQSAVIIVSPTEIIDTMGVVHYITLLLYVNGINITQIISSYVDTIIIVGRSDSIKTYRVLEEAIASI